MSLAGGANRRQFLGTAPIVGQFVVNLRRYSKPEPSGESRDGGHNSTFAEGESDGSGFIEAPAVGDQAQSGHRSSHRLGSADSGPKRISQKVRGLGREGTI